jgi:hypothetical protein
VAKTQKSTAGYLLKNPTADLPELMLASDVAAGLGMDVDELKALAADMDIIAVLQREPGQRGVGTAKYLRSQVEQMIRKMTPEPEPPSEMTRMQETITNNFHSLEGVIDVLTARIDQGFANLGRVITALQQTVEKTDTGSGFSPAALPPMEDNATEASMGNEARAPRRRHQ